MAARERFIPIVHRAEMLGELMRLTSPSPLSAHTARQPTSLGDLDSAGVDPIVINGGIITDGKYARLGRGQWMVVEADGATALPLVDRRRGHNIDPEHLDHHGTYDALEQAVRRLHSHGLPRFASTIRSAAPDGRHQGRRIITYGMSANADVRAVNLSTGRLLFDVMLSDRTAGGFMMPSVRFPIAALSRTALPRSRWRWRLACFPTASQRPSTASAGSAGASAKGSAAASTDRRLRSSGKRAPFRPGASGTNKLIAVVQPRPPPCRPVR